MQLLARQTKQQEKGTKKGNQVAKTVAANLTTWQERRAAYEKVKNLYKKDRSAVAELVLSGKWKEPPMSRVGHHKTLKERRRVLEAPSVEDDQGLSSRETSENLVAPITH